MWHLRAWLSGAAGGARGMTGLDGLRGLSRPLQFHGSMILYPNPNPPARNTGC